MSQCSKQVGVSGHVDSARVPVITDSFMSVYFMVFNTLFGRINGHAALRHLQAQ